MNLPQLELRKADGAPAPWPELWQRQNLLLLIAHPDCETCRRVLRDWSRQREELEAENTRPLVVFAEDPGPLDGGVEVILDPDGRLCDRLGVEPGTALAVDRYFEIRATEDVHAVGADESATDTLDWVKLAERECPECGVPTW